MTQTRLELTPSTRFKLNNGVMMPCLGLGTWQTEAGAETRNSVRSALEAGYRLIDTAAMYGNERDVGDALRQSGLRREEVFITTKLWNDEHGYEPALRACDRSLHTLGLDYVDLYLIHWPSSGRRAETWRAMEKILEEGKALSIGVSNYYFRHLEEMKEYAKVPPAVDQVEFSPFTFERDLLDYCKANRIQLEAYSPLTRARRLGDARIAGIAGKHGKSPAQVLIRWGLQHGVVEIPKSRHEDRIIENRNVFDFVLDEEDMAELDSISTGSGK